MFLSTSEMTCTCDQIEAHCWKSSLTFTQVTAFTSTEPHIYHTRVYSLLIVKSSTNNFSLSKTVLTCLWIWTVYSTSHISCLNESAATWMNFSWRNNAWIFGKTQKKGPSSHTHAHTHSRSLRASTKDENNMLCISLKAVVLYIRKHELKMHVCGCVCSCTCYIPQILKCVCVGYIPSNISSSSNCFSLWNSST